MVRVDGIEPTTPAWKAGVLPLNYTRRNEPVKWSCTGSAVKSGMLLNASNPNFLPEKRSVRSYSAPL
jgi:hypothetical protein